MSDDRAPGFDPRFSPAFQRGFDPETAVDEPLGEPPVSPPEPAPRAQQPAAPDSVAANDPDDPDVPAVDVGAAALLDAAPEEVASSRNPFLIVLAVVAVVLIVGGVWIFARSGSAFNSKEVRSQGDYMTLDATIHSAPFIALLGVATAIGLLFVFAVAWRRKR